jgi:hypothetical protein
MIPPYHDPRDLWQVQRAELECTYASLHLQRLARRTREAPEGEATASSGRLWNLLRYAYCALRVRLSESPLAGSARVREECCPELR